MSSINRQLAILNNFVYDCAVALALCKISHGKSGCGHHQCGGHREDFIIDPSEDGDPSHKPMIEARLQSLTVTPLLNLFNG